VTSSARNFWDEPVPPRRSPLEEAEDLLEQVASAISSLNQLLGSCKDFAEAKRLVSNITQVLLSLLASRRTGPRCL
jgi:hypothetical protein